MTLEDTISGFSDLSAAKTKFLTKNPLGFWTASMMAGAYVGMGILLIFSVGQNADPSSRTLVMGVSFGIALTLVVFAGSELFTGHTMYMTIGRLTGKIRSLDMLRAWGVTWAGNLAGSALLGALFVAVTLFMPKGIVGSIAGIVGVKSIWKSKGGRPAAETADG